jgi:multisubunit Na+/H+ antiporter MnhB subunit
MRGLVVGALCLALGIILVVAVLDLPDVPDGESPPVLATLDESGVDQPVTAVLLNFRGYDTWLEVGVLVLAVLGVLTAQRTHGLAREPSNAPHDPMLTWLARLLVPFMVLAGGYLLWLGTREPGGAFQAGAVLGAAGVLARLAGLGPDLETLFSGRPLRLLALFGFLVFLLVAVGTLIAGRSMLQFPTNWAGGLIFVIEAAVTISIGWTLAFLYAGATPRREEATS